MSNKDIFIIIPAYNEGSVIHANLTEVLRTGFSVVVVDDGSRDETWSIVKDLPLFALRHRVNLGQGAALQTGVEFALSQGAKFIVHFDADGQHRVQDIAVLLEPVAKGDVDIALGSRFLRYQDTKSLPWLRAFLLRGAVIVNGFLTGLWLTDAHNGLRVMSREAARKIVLKENGFAHASEIIQQIRKLRLRYEEKPTKVKYTSYSMKKGQSFWNAFNIVFDMIVRGIFK